MRSVAPRQFRGSLRTCPRFPPRRTCNRERFKGIILVIRNRRYNTYDADSSLTVWSPHCRTSFPVAGRVIRIPILCARVQCVVRTGLGRPHGRWASEHRTSGGMLSIALNASSACAPPHAAGIVHARPPGCCVMLTAARRGRPVVAKATATATATAKATATGGGWDEI